MIEVNYLGVLFAAIVSMGVGFLWYGPILFAKPWMKLMGYTAESLKKEQAQMGKTYAISFLLALVTAYVLSHVMSLSAYFYQTDAVMTGLTSAFWMWLGFVMPVQATEVMFGGKKFALFAINTGYQFFSLLVMGLVLGLV
ncbi:MAG TPA: DUF1761 domain-containing protein [Patescibacteria group bacterium]|nr:DUF1761 domain-containing protein [Patescibacteria group bacterium]